MTAPDLRILVLAPVGRDGTLLVATLADHGVTAEPCADLAECVGKSADGAGGLLITQEGLAAGDARALVDALDHQPSWSALPVIVLVTGDAGDRPELLTRLGLATGVVTLLERPVRQASLVSAVHVALATRRRQYEVRDLLAQRSENERRLRKQAAALEASRSRFREMADAAPAMLWVTDAGNACTFLSRGWYEFTGETPEAARQGGWLQPIHADDRGAAERMFGRASARREPFKLAFRLRTARGSYRWVFASARPWTGPEGDFLGYIGSVVDIHELRLAEQEKQRSHALLDAVLDSLPVGVVIADARGGLLRWNQAHETLWGLDGMAPGATPDMAAYAVWKGWWSETGEPIRPEQWTLSRALLDGRAVSGTLVDIQPFDGGPRRTTLNAGAPVRDEDGTIVAAVAAQMDVTDMLQMERALRDSEEKFRTLADNIAQFAWMADAMGYIFWYNRRWFEYTGTTLEEVEGWGWRSVHHPDHVDRVAEKFSHKVRAGEVWEDLFPLRGRDGSYRWFLSRAVPVRDSQGRVTRWFGTNTDVTEQRQAEETLREADRRKDEFLATLAHELRNPLAPIRTAVELLRLKGSDPETIALSRDIVDRQVRDLTRLVDDLLEVSRITRGKVQLRRETVSLADIVQRAVEASRPMVDAAGHRLTVTLPDVDLWLYADHTRLTQVLTNLLNNAATYTPDGGRIDVTATKVGDRVHVSVRDSGVGISRDQLPRIFEMFSQLRPVLERPNAGLGIGLALAKGLVELHHGTISAASDGEGQGSEFVITLPLCDAPEREADVAQEAADHGAPLRILVVDDNRDAADGLALMLELMGHAPMVAYDGPEALITAERELPNVVLLDIGLPAMNGYEVARRIRQASWGRHMKLVAQTGWGNEQDRQRATAAGFDHHLIKPLDAARLAALLARLR